MDLVLFLLVVGVLFDIVLAHDLADELLKFFLVRFCVGLWGNGLLLYEWLIVGFCLCFLLFYRCLGFFHLFLHFFHLFLHFFLFFLFFLICHIFSFYFLPLLLHSFNNIYYLLSLRCQLQTVQTKGVIAIVE